jgi:hypothetical protein
MLFLCEDGALSIRCRPCVRRPAADRLLAETVMVPAGHARVSVEDSEPARFGRLREVQHPHTAGEIEESAGTRQANRAFNNYGRTAIRARRFPSTVGG